MLDDKDRVTEIYEMVQHAHEPIDVGEMQPRSRLVEDIERISRVGAAEFLCELYALRLAAA